MHGVGPAEGSDTVTCFLLRGREQGPMGAHWLLHLGGNQRKHPRGCQFQQYQFQQQRREGKHFRQKEQQGPVTRREDTCVFGTIVLEVGKKVNKCSPRG